MQVSNNPAVICKLLRAIAGGTDAKASKHDVIFNAAADIIEKLQAEIDDIYNEAMGEDL